MSAHSTTSRAKESSNDWQPAFLEMLPMIEKQLRYGFRSLKGEAKEEAIQEGLVNCTVHFEVPQVLWALG